MTDLEDGVIKGLLPEAELLEGWVPPEGMDQVYFLFVLSLFEISCILSFIHRLFHKSDLRSRNFLKTYLPRFPKYTKKCNKSGFKIRC